VTWPEALVNVALIIAVAFIVGRMIR